MGILSRKKEETEKSTSENLNLESVNVEEKSEILETKETKETSAFAKAMADKKETGKIKEVSEKKKARKISGEKEILADNSIMRPWVSEKSAIMAGKGIYTFKVAKDVSKNSVKDVIESLFDVNVLSVNILNIKGKLKNFKGKSGQRSDSKKAVVTLREGQKIEELAI